MPSPRSFEAPWSTPVATSGSLSTARRYAQERAMPPPPGLLNRREANSELVVAAASRRAFNLALATPCPTHAALTGEGCWTVTGDRPHPALCGSRVTFALGTRRRPR